ncbi:hypothetical protein THAOC_02501 [Thalassiosira oceanica]|uniref:Exostosin GT47 domain-containing protein n=1 Tax=Thalassiosira oceanica TaxID=159749 RepID=K0TAN0_THAOC|nr:hypothetical protein THAOC_02501 [Thalassiosira oceanica]|eukprot:EJK75773.1 hypothetical protein THAOC_02501 [Thalassiosira oceanica]
MQKGLGIARGRSRRRTVPRNFCSRSLRRSSTNRFLLNFLGAAAAFILVSLQYVISIARINVGDAVSSGVNLEAFPPSSSRLRRDNEVTSPSRGDVYGHKNRNGGVVTTAGGENSSSAPLPAAPLPRDERRGNYNDRFGGVLSSLHDDDNPLTRMANELNSTRLRYYIYTKRIRVAHNTKVQGNAEVWSIYRALQRHPLRTVNPSEAHFFIPPIFTNTISPALKQNHPDRIVFQAVLDIVTSSSIYQTAVGSRHIFLVFDGLDFSYKGVGGRIQQLLKEYYPSWLTEDVEPRWFNHSDSPCPLDAWVNEGRAKRCLPGGNIFRNIILARDRDVFEVHRRVHRDKHSFSPDWTKPFAMDDPIPQWGFSVGLLSGTAQLPIVEATFDDFSTRKWIYFYHARADEYFCNSTQYRLAPINILPKNGTVEAETFAQSSVGYDLPSHLWKEYFMSSRFCLVIRGDTPHSRAFLRAVKVGCIPVVVSDAYPWYAPSLPATLNMSDYSIMISERAFLQDPWKELHRATQLTEKSIRQKLDALAFAQRVIFADHNESLFVPALLKEAWNSIPPSQRVVGCVDWTTGKKSRCHE